MSGSAGFRHRLLQLGTVITITCALSCANSADRVERDDRPSRLSRTTPQEYEWSVRFTIGGTADDSTLLLPTKPAANSAGVYVADVAAKRVAHFNHDGQLVWTFGRGGQGPGEFEGPRDLRLDASGRVWVLDQDNRRATVLTAAGELERIITLDLGYYPTEIAPLADGTTVVAVASAERPFVRIDSSGAVLSTHPFPWKRFSALNTMATQFLTAHDPATSEWAVAFRLGDGFFAFQGTESTQHAGWFVEKVPFPIPVITQSDNVTRTSFTDVPITAASSVTLSPERLYVLFGGTTQHRFRVVDGYSRADGSYQGSFLLPSRAHEIAWHDGGLFVLREDPYPELVYLIPASGRLP